MEQVQTLDHSLAQTLATNRLIRNTYILLALTLAFSAVMAGVSMSLQLKFNLVIFLVGAIGLQILTNVFRNSAIGIVCVFAFTGFMGMTLGPVLSHFLKTPHGTQLVMQALGATALIFFTLSAYALISRKDFSFMRGFLFVGLMVAFFAGLAAYIFGMSTLSLAVSAAFVLLSSGLILYQTSEMVNGGETNYIMATVTLYVSLYNLFVSLLRLLAAFAGED